MVYSILHIAYSILYIGVQYNIYLCIVYSILVYSILRIGVQYTAYWCTVYCIMVYSILYIGVQYTIYCCIVYCILVYSILPIGVQYTAYWCTVYCVLVYSILHIGVQYTAYWCTIYCISSHCTAVLAYFLVVLKNSKEIKSKTDFKFKCWASRLYSRRRTLRGESCCLTANVITVQRHFHSYIAITVWHSLHTALYCAVPYCLDVTDRL